jgi:hypothetical protein
MPDNIAFHEESDGWHAFSGSTVLPLQATGGGEGSGIFGDPGEGNVYYGLTIPNLTARENYIGRRVGLTRRYSDVAGSSGALSLISGDIAAGRLPWVSYKVDGIPGADATGWAAFAAGNGDSWFSGVLSGLNAIGGGPIILTLHHEANGDGAATDYQAMYAHAHTMTSAYPQILLAPNLSWGYSTITTGTRAATWFNPATCDIFTFDSYNHVSYSPANGKKDLSVNQVFGLQRNELAQLDPTKPWAVGEWGVRTGANGINVTNNEVAAAAGSAATWMKDAYDYCRNSGCYAMAYFDSGTNVKDGGSPWTLNDTTDGTSGVERLAQFKTDTLKTTSKIIPPGGL